MNIQIIDEIAAIDSIAMDDGFIKICLDNGLKHDPNANLALVRVKIGEQIRLELRKLNDILGAVYVDFTSQQLRYRRKFGGAKNEAIAKAIGVKKSASLTVLDATAGLGKDAFILASLGCQVSMIERNSVVFLILKDGLIRGYQDREIGNILQNNLKLLPIRSIEQINSQMDKVDVVYLDPMFPHKTKTALVKKEMQILQYLVGNDEDADQLLAYSLTLAKKRVVVKRPKYADFLADKRPDFSQLTKKHRFDVYINHSSSL